MKSAPGKTVRIVKGEQRPRLSKGQEAFNALITLIDKKRAVLAAWESAIPPYQHKHTTQLVPLLDTMAGLQIRLVHGLDQASFDKGLTRAERRMITEVIVELAGELLADRDDAALKAIYNRHSKSDYDSEEAAAAKGVKSMLEDVLGVELGNDDEYLRSPEELFERAEAEIFERQARFDADRQARKDSASKRGQSAKQIAREAQQHAEAQRISQSIREVYRKLVSALHPDRETDPKERDRKTGLMQRVNQAYEKNNLLQLLELQLELEHIDQAVLNNLSEDRLRHYNKILREQLDELEQEIRHVEDGFRAQFGLDPFMSVAPRKIMRHLADDIADIELAIDELKTNLRAFGDIKRVKAWLRRMRDQNRMDDLNDLPF